MKPKTYNLKPSNEGQALVISILIVGFLLSIALTLSSLFIPKIRASSEIKKSSAALYAAESGLEWCLYVNRHSTVAAPVMANSATYINGNTSAAFVPSDCLISPIKSLGTYQGISRSLEITVEAVALPPPSPSPTPSLTPSPTPIVGLPSGGQTYLISSSAEVLPRFLSVTMDPLDVKVGDTQVLTTKVWSDTPIVSVTTVTELDTRIMNLGLLEISKDETGTTFSNSWVVFDTHVKTYHTKFIATDEAGRQNSITFAWSDPCTGITQGQDSPITAGCTVDGISGLDGGNLTINSGVNLTLNAGSTWVFNPGKSITVDGSISIVKGSPGGQIKKSCLYYTDVDGDTYAPSGFTMSEDSGCGSISQKVRVMSAGSHSLTDCYEADPATTNAELAHPDQTSYFTCDREGGASCTDGSFDYDCNTTADKADTTYASACNTTDSGACNVVPPGPCRGAQCSTTSSDTPVCGGTYTVYMTTDGGNCNGCIQGPNCTLGSCTAPKGPCAWRMTLGGATCGGTSKISACR